MIVTENNILLNHFRNYVINELSMETIKTVQVWKSFRKYVLNALGIFAPKKKIVKRRQHAPHESVFKKSSYELLEVATRDVL